MVDKVFADWQNNPESEPPNLDTRRIIQPFDSEEFNKYTLTKIPPAKTLDFESNLCYCYDCDLDQDFNEVKLPERTGEFLPGGQPIFEPIEQLLIIRPPPIRLPIKPPPFRRPLYSDEFPSMIILSGKGRKFDSLTGPVR